MSTPRQYGQEKFHRIGVRLNQELKAQLEEEAVRQGITVSHAVQDAIVDYITKQKYLREHG